MPFEHRDGVILVDAGASRASSGFRAGIRISALPRVSRLNRMQEAAPQLRAIGIVLPTSSGWF